MSETEPSGDPDNSQANFPIIALCASAGGLQAFLAFFDAMPVHNGMAIIVVQHLAEHQESILHELIQQKTSLAVHLIAKRIEVEPNNVYVLPAGYDLNIENGQLHLSPRQRTKGWPRTIDRFLIALAKDQGEWAAVAILSGVGTDGLEGSRPIKEAGGLVIAQTTESATQSGMPSSLIDAGLADAILEPERMPGFLLGHFKINLQKVQLFENLTDNITDAFINKVIRLLQRREKRNFSDYKRSTLRRQIARRMGMHQFATPDEYIEYVEQNPDEAQQLVKYLLINVTHFFRDPDSFELLKTAALLPALSKLDIETIFRAWVPGCATGEEAVSIAILIYECLRELDMLAMEVRIFATDISPHTLELARSGLYPPTIAQDVTPARLADHFVEEEFGYRVRAHIARMIIWSQHNLAEHPPFSNLHLISCRNVLIYFQRQLQERVTVLFEFALQPEGILFLGSSETLPYSIDAFSVIDSKHKIYQRNPGRTSAWLGLDQPLFIRVPDYMEHSMTESNPHQDRDKKDYELEIIRNALVEYYASTCVLVDEQYRVRYTYGEIDRYLRIVPGREGQHNILDMAREGLDVELTIALHQAFESNETVTRQGVWVKANGDERIINLIVHPINKVATRGQKKLVIFEISVDGDSLQNSDEKAPDGGDGATITRLREELLQTQKALQNVTQALQAKSEELTSSMEEIRSANEEIQTTNEELRTSKEELESMNAELNTLNTQLRDQNFQLTNANNTLHNFLQAADVAIIFLDQSMLVREFTTAATNIFSLRPSDKGRPLSEIANQLNYASLIEDAEGVLDTIVATEREVHTTDGRWYNLRIRPYRTTNNAIDGLVLSFSEITAQKVAQEILERQNNYVRQVFDTIANSLIELDDDLRVVGANQSFYDLFQTSAEGTIGQLLYNLGNGQWDIPELRRLLTEIIPDQMVIHDYTVTQSFPELGMRTMTLNARKIADVERILLVITDISEARSDKAD